MPGHLFHVVHARNKDFPFSRLHRQTRAVDSQEIGNEFPVFAVKSSILIDIEGLERTMSDATLLVAARGMLWPSNSGAEAAVGILAGRDIPAASQFAGMPLAAAPVLARAQAPAKMATAA
ncbi:MAG: hypothetical protein E5W70_15625 [Mesorhizobium sp.]|uniref:hypothetical protein n=1 Tax=Mesorhizobium sp. TaxID=1871066 RepID=UPI001214CC29|nr:hypothetical protein [Mesorhizobium sp.]TIT21721.1 MAG: hypothetical protein E5W70_15625 [Mesorhizobium sp.]